LPRHRIQPAPIGRDGFQDHNIALAADADLLALEAEFLWQADGLAAAGPEQLGGFHGGVSKW